jgi:hypothetical protein
MFKRSRFAFIALTSLVLAGCGHSEGVASDSKSQADSSGNTNTFPSPKLFAHRYNEYATDNLKVVEVQDIGGVGAEDWTHLYLADKADESIAGQAQQASFNYDPRYATQDVIRNVCAWMVRAANPNISSSDAMAMAATVVDKRVKVVVDNTILDVYTDKYDKGCKVYYTGL